MRPTSTSCCLLQNNESAIFFKTCAGRGKHDVKNNFVSKMATKRKGKQQHIGKATASREREAVKDRRRVISSLSRGRGAHLIHVLKRVDDVIRQAGQQVDNKPRLQVVHPNQLGV